MDAVIILQTLQMHKEPRRGVEKAFTQPIMGQLTIKVTTKVVNSLILLPADASLHHASSQ